MKTRATIPTPSSAKRRAGELMAYVMLQHAEGFRRLSPDAIEALGVMTKEALQDAGVLPLLRGD